MKSKLYEIIYFGSLNKSEISNIELKTIYQFLGNIDSRIMLLKLIETESANSFAPEERTGLDFLNRKEIFQLMHGLAVLDLNCFGKYNTELDWIYAGFYYEIFLNISLILDRTAIEGILENIFIYRKNSRIPFAKEIPLEINSYNKYLDFKNEATIPKRVRLTTQFDKVPEVETLLLPMLEFFSTPKQNYLDIEDITPIIIKDFELTEYCDLNKLRNQVLLAIKYLHTAGLINNVSKYNISKKGLNILNENPDKITPKEILNLILKDKYI